MQKITPFLWFNNQAEEAALFYISIFKDSKLGKVVRYGAAGPGEAGAVMSVTFQLEGQEFFALNGGPQYGFTPAISFFVNCTTQEEVDRLWDNLSEGGEPGRCGWLKDKYGISWQVVPSMLGKLMQDGDKARSGRVVQALMQMNKLDIQKLQDAYDGTVTTQPAP